MVWASVLTYLLLPFIEIGGESALRFDVPTLRLHFMGTALWTQEFFVVMLACLFGVLLFFSLTLVFGRMWCGWLCPQTILSDITEPIITFKQRGFWARFVFHVSIALFSLLVGFSTVCYFVSPYEAIPQIFAFELGPIASGSTIVIAILLYLNLVFLRRTFCSTICPYAKFQGAITDSKSLVICMDETRRDECIDCKQCVKVCPTELDIRKGVQVSCIMCAACVDACTPVMAKKGNKGLIHYQFGTLGKFSLQNLLRPGVIALSLLVLATLILFTSQVFFRTSFDFNILPHSLTPRYTKDGEIINAYILSIKNLGNEDIKLNLTVAHPDELRLNLSITEPLTVPAGLAEKFSLFVRTNGKNLTDRKVTFALKSPEQTVKKSAFFVIP